MREDAPAGRCFSCRLTRTRPAADDTVALEKLASTEEAKRRLLLQLGEPRACPSSAGTSSRAGSASTCSPASPTARPVMIGHANGIITIDLAESLDDRREALRVRLGEPYRTMLGHLRHEVGHYYQNVLLTDDDAWDSVPRAVRRRARQLS